jgi:hypothetical protein
MTGNRLKAFSFLALFLGLLAESCCAFAQPQNAAEPLPKAWTSPTNDFGIQTNGPSMYRVLSYSSFNVVTNQQFLRIKRLLESTNPIPPIIRERLRTNREPEFQTNSYAITNLVFQRFLPNSLNYLVWTNVIANTNGRSMQMWSTREHPPGWPDRAVNAVWNRRSLVYGMRGFTALSPCWEMEGGSGQVPITALTRRHGYTRGHGMGPGGFRQNYAGKKVWFLSADDKRIEVKIRREVVQTRGGEDYTIVLFDRDLPASIEPLRVINATNMFSRFVSTPEAPYPVFRTEQEGHVTVELPGLMYGYYKGGDSGSPNLLPMPGELVFIAGRSTSTPSPIMQADMDELCRKEGLQPANYQMQWFDISQYPVFKTQDGSSVR